MKLLHSRPIRFGLMAILVVYIAAMAPGFNQEVDYLFSNVYLQIMYLACTAYVAFRLRNAPLAILMFVAYLISIQGRGPGPRTNEVGDVAPGFGASSGLADPNKGVGYWRNTFNTQGLPNGGSVITGAGEAPTGAPL